MIQASREEVPRSGIDHRQNLRLFGVYYIQPMMPSTRCRITSAYPAGPDKQDPHFYLVSLTGQTMIAQRGPTRFCFALFPLCPDQGCRERPLHVARRSEHPPPD